MRLNSCPLPPEAALVAKPLGPWDVETYRDVIEDDLMCRAAHKQAELDKATIREWVKRTKEAR